MIFGLFSSGNKKAQIEAALRTLRLPRNAQEDDSAYSGRAAAQVTSEIMNHAGVRIGTRTEDDLFMGGVFVFVLSNHIARILNAQFEIAASSGLIVLMMEYGMSLSDAAASNKPVADVYNQLTTENSKYLQAVAQNFDKWIAAPTTERLKPLAELFVLGRQHLGPA